MFENFKGNKKTTKKFFDGDKNNNFVQYHFKYFEKRFIECKMNVFHQIPLKSKHNDDRIKTITLGELI